MALVRFDPFRALAALQGHLRVEGAHRARVGGVVR